MSPRRVVRSSTDSPATDITEKWSTKSFGIFLIFRWLILLIQFIWKVIRFFWYWFQRIWLVALLFFLTIWLAWWLSHTPSLYRDWLPAETLLPSMSFSGNEVSIKNIRNHSWTSATEFTPGYYDAVYNLDDITWLSYIITPFSEIDGVAHTMFSFSFSGGRNLIISPEARKERWEIFEPLLGMLNQFEIMYVIADENDSLQLRTNYRKNEVYMYPIRAEKKDIEWLFRSMLIRADKLSREPEFYNTFWNNCATALLSHANAFRINKLQAWNLTLFPKYSDELLYDAKLIDTTHSLEEARKQYRIDEYARTLSGEVDFSEFIHLKLAQ